SGHPPVLIDNSVESCTAFGAKCCRCICWALKIRSANGMDNSFSIEATSHVTFTVAAPGMMDCAAGDLGCKSAGLKVNSGDGQGSLDLCQIPFIVFLTTACLLSAGSLLPHAFYAEVVMRVRACARGASVAYRCLPRA